MKTTLLLERCSSGVLEKKKKMEENAFIILWTNSLYYVLHIYTYMCCSIHRSKLAKVINVAVNSLVGQRVR